MAYRNSSPIINLLTELYDLIDEFLIIGIVLSAIFALLTVLVISWALNVPSVDNSTVIAQILAPISYLRWLVVLAPGVPMVMFLTKTYQSWVKLR